MCARHLHEMIVKEGEFDAGDLEGAVKKGYMALDAYLLRCGALSKPVCRVANPWVRNFAAKRAKLSWLSTSRKMRTKRRRKQ